MPLNLDLAFLIFILIVSVILHEIAHGYVAYLCGDPTAYREGRLTLNPIPHIDPMMTVIVPAMFIILSKGAFIFGGAKPVPINPYLLRNKPRDYLLVSLAGVAVNFLIAFVLTSLSEIPLLSPQTQALLVRGAFLNIFLGVFNLVPIPPLDGSRVVETFLPRKARDSYMQLQPFGFMIIIGILWMGGIQFIIYPVHWIQQLMLLPFQ